MHRIGMPSLALLLALGAAAPAVAAQTSAYMTTTDFNGAGAVSRIALDTRAVTADAASVYKDAVLRWYGGLLYVVNRFGQDNIQVIDPAAGYATIRNFSVGNGTNPQDICFVSPTKAYVSRLGSADLLVVNPSHPAGLPMSTIPLGAFADGDGVPDLARMVRVDRRLFVVCQRLTGFQPSNPSMIVVIDTETDAVIDCDPVQAGVQGITLAGRNPTTTFAFDRGGSRLLIGCTGAFGVNDGGIEAIDPVGLTSLGFAITEAELEGDVLGLAWYSPTHSYAIVGDASFNTALVSWNPATGERIAPVYQPGGFSLSDVEVDDRGEVYVANSGFTTPGVVVFAAGSDALLAGPLGVGLAPFDIVFDASDNVVTGVPPAVTLDLRLSAPWPNPARSSVRLALRLDAPAQVSAGVFDLAGRRVRRLLDGQETMGERWIEWDLMDSSGAPVSAGIYLMRIEVDGRPLVRRVVVAR